MFTAPDNQQPILRMCKDCGETKSIEEFAVYDAKLGRRRHTCDTCRRVYQASWARGEVIPRHLGEHRTCVVCNTKKHVDEFSIVYSERTRGKQYRSHTCLECYRTAHRKKERERREKNPQEFLDRERRTYARNRIAKNIQKREYHRKLRNACFEAYGGYRCRCCGETEPTMLTIDHINGNGGDHRRAIKGGRWAATMYLWLVHHGFPKGFQVLCYNCNLSKFRCGGICAHQKAGSTTIPKGSRAKRLEVPSVSKRR